ncbi:DUF3592 domain-containing protein [Paraburkholderia pallida]|uniref:DUF3592 domain-containing protein n=1 Tax=Paraburkholderia pallida TaxID=2547399 RepID=UPI00142F794C|nr:DUF3592 domain-containing protein [Paraburkholderia pallida]
MRTTTIIGAPFFVFGIGFLSLGIWLWHSDARFAEHAVRTQGKVTDLIAGRDSKGNLSYHTQFEFTTPDGQRLRATGSAGTSSPDYSLGDTVPVLYDPADPEDAEIDSFLERSFGALIVSLLGSISALVGGGLLAASIYSDSHGRRSSRKARRAQ